ncbi:MAG: thioredoxin domain-containing protein [Desulfobacterales bacterium]|nr:thioredoxin domain-containing protein [Desulfobacterales bacterium]
MTGSIEKLKSEVDVDITWTAFPLHPETPLEGQTLAELFAGRDLDIPRMLVHLKKTADGLGLPFGERPNTYNSRRAQELGKWAQSLGRGDQFHHAAFAAYFADGRNIADLEVLAGIAKAAGLPEEDVAQVVESGRFSPAVDTDWQRSHQLGIQVVPTFQANGRKMEGAKSYEALLEFVKATSKGSPSLQR